MDGYEPRSPPSCLRLVLRIYRIVTPWTPVKGSFRLCTTKPRDSSRLIKPRIFPLLCEPVFQSRVISPCAQLLHMATTYTQPPYQGAPPNQQYPVDQNMHAYGPPSQPQQDPPQPWPQQQSMQPVPIQSQYQQPPYPTPQYPPQQQQQQQQLQPSYPATPMGAGYPPIDPRVAQLVRPEIGSRVSSHRSTHSHKSHHSHEDGDEHHHHHHHHHHDHKTKDIDSRPTIGDSVFWVWDSIKAAMSGKK